MLRDSHFRKRPDGREAKLHYRRWPQVMAFESFKEKGGRTGGAHRAVLVLQERQQISGERRPKLLQTASPKA